MDAITALVTALKIVDTSQGLVRKWHELGNSEGSLTVENKSAVPVLWAFAILGNEKNPTRSYGWFRLSPGETFGKSVNTYRPNVITQCNHWRFAAITENGSSHIPSLDSGNRTMPVAFADGKNSGDCQFTIRWTANSALILTDESRAAKRIQWVPCFEVTQYPGGEIAFTMSDDD
ncbi:hypothetical protein [Streptomyces sp. NPDC048606]|uniref:hypothetical protein n=1 Tax=Streptomyces sp. NPDC048606 TaxID=3154726 RepID=UPI003444CFA6